MQIQMYTTTRRNQLFSFFFGCEQTQAAPAQPPITNLRPRGAPWHAFGAGVAGLGPLRAMPGVWAESDW
ncbi:MAG TPA: hypothetical protein VF897_13065 [Roseiflexaceae bacterium]